LLWIKIAIALSDSLNVRYGSEADVTLLNFDVRFTPKSGHSAARSRCPLCAKSRHSALRQRLALFDHLVGLAA
jgi:hypothetical protein